MDARQTIRSTVSALAALAGALILGALIVRFVHSNDMVGFALIMYVLAVALWRPAVDTGAAVLGAIGFYGRFDRHGRHALAASLTLTAVAIALSVLARSRRRRHEEAEAALLGLERRYRRLVERNLAGVYRCDWSGAILDCNHAFAAMVGYRSREAALAANAAELYFDPAERNGFLRQMDEHKQISNHEICYRRQDGGPLWVLENASLIPGQEGEAAVIEGTLIDITERKRAEEAVANRERHFRALIENSSDAIALLDANGRFLYASDSTTRILGYTPAELVGRSFELLLHGDDRPAARASWRRALTQPGPTPEDQIRCRHRQGHWCWLEARLTNLLAEPAVAAVVVNYRDISERKLLEQQLRQAQKMEAMGRLAGGVAHDFNNLLTIITGYSEIALVRAEGDPLRRQLAEIKRAGDRAAALTRQLLTFSRQQTIAPQVLDLNAVVANMVQMLQPLLGEQIEIATALVSEPACVRADPGQIEQVLLNLAVNARDSMPQGGRLRLGTEIAEMAGAAAADGLAAGRYVVLSVRDTGVGMKPEVQSRIFEPFFTTKERGKGTGLGLAMVYGIVRQSGGHIEVRSEVGQGSEFLLSLPLAASESARTPREALNGNVAGQETILIAEDEDGVRELVRETLAAHGYRVLESRNGAEALHLSTQHLERIDLLLTDVVMPQLDGRRLAERLKILHPETKVLYMSGYVDPALSTGEAEPALQPLLPKPFSPELVPAKVREVLDGKLEAPERISS